MIVILFVLFVYFFSLLLLEIFQIKSFKNVLCGNPNCKFAISKWDYVYYNYKIKWNHNMICGVCKEKFQSFDYDLFEPQFGHYCEIYKTNPIEYDIFGGMFDGGYWIRKVNKDGTFVCEDRDGIIYKSDISFNELEKL